METISLMSFNVVGTKVIIQIDLPGISDGGYPFTFSADCGTAWVARLLYYRLSEDFFRRMQGIRRRAWIVGVAAGKRKRPTPYTPEGNLP